MRNFFLMIAMSGLFYTTLSGTLYDMTVADCNAGVVAACEEIARSNLNQLKTRKNAFIKASMFCSLHQQQNIKKKSARCFASC